MIKTMKEAEDLIYQSYLRAINNITEKKDAIVKKPILTKELFQLLNTPDAKQKFILVTGSKGKGSTARFIQSLLSHLGFKVGLFTSPHLVHFNERIRIDGKAISDQDFIRLSNEVVPSFNKIESRLANDEYQGPIGLVLAIATLYFKEKKTDINVIECGRGGLFDDTNILKNEWAVITTVMEEHVQELGPTLDDIISHKLGIIKGQTKFVYISEQLDSKVKDRLKHIGENEVAFYGTDFSAKQIRLNLGGTTFDVVTKNNTYTDIELPLLGGFHAVNVATAIKVCEDIYGKSITCEVVKNCFLSVKWPGRCEIIDRNPTVIVDGSIHETSARYVQQLMNVLSGKRIVSIVSVPASKDYKGVIKVISEFSRKIIITKPDISHHHFPLDAKEYASTLVNNVSETESLDEAVQLGKQEEDVDIILIIGTQTLVANAKRYWKQSLLNLGK